MEGVNDESPPVKRKLLLLKVYPRKMKRVLAEVFHLWTGDQGDSAMNFGVIVKDTIFKRHPLILPCIVHESIKRRSSACRTCATEFCHTDVGRVDNNHLGPSRWSQYSKWKDPLHAFEPVSVVLLSERIVAQLPLFRKVHVS